MVNSALVPAQPHANGVALYADNPAERRRMFMNLIQRNINEDQLRLLFDICDRYGFDPMLKHVILIQQGMYVTRDGMLQYAHRTGLFDGIEELAKGRDEDGKWYVTVAVHRKGCARPFVTTAYQAEHENEKSTPWQKSPYRMTYKCAALAALRMAFPVELGGAEEIGYDGVSARTNIGTATIIEGELADDEPPPPRRSLPPGKVEDYGDDDLLTVLGQERPPAQERRALTIYLNRAGDRADLTERCKSATRVGVPKDLVLEVARLVKRGLAEREPGAYQHHAREDGQPILGGTPDERQAMLARIRAAMAAAGKTEAQVNEYVGAVYNVAAFEVLTEQQARELLVDLEMAAAGRADSAFGEGAIDDTTVADIRELVEEPGW